MKRDPSQKNIVFCAEHYNPLGLIRALGNIKGGGIL